MKKSSDLALKMQRSRARFAGIWTAEIDQVNPAKARTPGRSDTSPLRAFHVLIDDLYPKHALKTPYITRSTSCVTRGLSRTSATRTIGRPDEQLRTAWRGSSKNWGRSWTSDAAIFMYHTSQVGLRSSQRFGIGPMRATTSLSPIHSRKHAGLAPHRGQGSICRLTSLMAP